MTKGLVKTKSFKILLLALVTFVFVLVSLVFVLWQVKNIAAELTENTRLIKNQQQLIEEAKQLADLLADTSEERTELANLVLSGNDTDVANFLSYLEGLAGQLNVLLETDSLNLINEKSSNFGQLVLEMSLSGSEKSVSNMLRLLETLPYHSQIRQLTFIRPGDEIEAEARFTLVITAKVN